MSGGTRMDRHNRLGGVRSVTAEKFLGLMESSRT